MTIFSFIKYFIYYYKSYTMFWILTLHFICYKSLSIKTNENFINLVICIFLIVFLEWCWLCYLVKAQPYISFSENRILIVNQIMVVILGILSSISLITVLIFNIGRDELLYNLDNNFLDIIDWISWMWVLPISYTLFCFHYIFIKTCYKKKKNFIYPRFWKLKNPNRHYARDDSFTEYMAYNSYGEY